MKKIRVLVADDHALMRMGLVALFRTDASLTVIGEAEDGFQAVELAVQTRPDVIVLDLQMPGLSGAEVVHAVKKKYPDVKIVILTTFSISDSIARALDAGAEGALLKSTPNEKLIDIVHRVADGKKYVSDEVKSLIESDLPLPPLSPRQKQILEAVAEGLSNKEIADRLDLKPSSIKSYFDILFNKLGVASRAEAVAIALRKHLLKI